jgi:hypothetical protein
MSANTLLPQGGLNNGSLVYILGIYQNDLYALVYNSMETSMVKVYTNPTSGSTLNTALSQIITFRLGFAGDSYLFVTNTTPSQYLVTSSNVLVLSAGPPIQAQSLYLNQNTYTQLGSPSLLLSNVSYMVTNEAGVVQVRLADGNLVTMSLLVVPTTFFRDCLSGGNPVTDVQSVMNLTYCSRYNQSWCSTVPKQGWTTESECLEGNTYTYCPNGTTCSGNCKSACLSSPEAEVCVLQAETYECIPVITGVPFAPIIENNNATVPLSDVTAETSWLTIIIIIIAIVIVVGVLIYVAYHSSKRRSDYHVSHEEHYILQQQPMQQQQPMHQRVTVGNYR